MSVDANALPAAAAQRTTARVGLLVPSTNSVMEPDLWTALWPRASVHTSRLTLDDVTPEAERRMLAIAPAAAADIAGLGADVSVFGCTSAGGILGRKREREMLLELEAAAASPVISVIGAVLEQLRLLGARSLAIFTPYVATLGTAVADSFAAEGFGITRVRSLGLTDNATIGALSPDAITDAVVASCAGSEADVVFVSCTNLQAFAARDAIERELGRPVVTSNSAVADAVNRRLSLISPDAA